MANTKRAKQPSLRDLARNAKPRVEHYDIPLVDHDEAVEAAERLADAKRELRAQERFGVAETQAAAQKALTEAQAAWDECFRRVTFRGLSPNDIDALSNEHPDPEDKDNPPEGYVEFNYHLAVASCVNGEDMTAEDWKDLAENVWPGPQTSAFLNAVRNANSREFSEGLKKD